MLKLILTAALLVQGPALSNQNGTISGVLRSIDGTPAAGVRVSALTRPDAINDLAAAASFAGLGETDSAGRYRLENIPPGRYYIVAGRVDAPTYYPGTLQVSDGALVAITPGLTVSSIDFVLNAGSVGRANNSIFGVLGVSSASWVIPIQTRIEGGGKIPVFAAGQFPMLRVGGTVVSLSGPSVTLTVIASVNTTTPTPLGIAAPVPDYRVTIDNLPETYELKSLTSGSTNLKVDALQLPSGISGTVVRPAIVVTLAVRAIPQSAGVRVSGRIAGDPKHALYISGNAGALYTDGTFEFIGVPAGRHNIVAFDSSSVGRSLGASIVVGDRDLPNIELEEISIAPADSDLPAIPAPAGNRPPGSRIITTSIRGRVVDGETGEPFNAGKVVINGNYAVGFSLNNDGRFEVPRLLPGKYFLEAVVFGIGTVSREVILDEADAAVDLSIGASR